MSGMITGFQTQGTKPLGRQNCKWPPILNFLTCITGKTGELRNSCFFKSLVQKLGELTKLSVDAAY